MSLLTSPTTPTILLRLCIREGVKYYFADFVRKGGGGTPHIRNLFFGPKTGVFWAKITIFSTFLRRFFGGMSVKGGGGVPPESVTFFLEKILSVKGGGGTPLTDKIRKVEFEVLPKPKNLPIGVKEPLYGSTDCRIKLPEEVKDVHTADIYHVPLACVENLCSPAGAGEHKVI